LLYLYLIILNQVTLLLVDRRTAAAVAALSQTIAPRFGHSSSEPPSSPASAPSLLTTGHGVQNLEDPSLVWFAKRCVALGLSVECQPVPTATLQRVADSQVFYILVGLPRTN